MPSSPSFGHTTFLCPQLLQLAGTSVSRPNENVISQLLWICFAFCMHIELVAVHKCTVCVLWDKHIKEKGSQAWFTISLILIGVLVL